MALGTAGALVAGTVGSSLIGANAASKGAKAQADAADKANDTQRYMYDKSVELQTPWRETGVNALAQMSQLMGLPSVANTTTAPATQPQAAMQPQAHQGGAANLPNQYNEEQLRRLGMWRGGEATPAYFAAKEAANRPPVQQVAQPAQQPATTTTTSDDPYAGFRASPGYQWSVDQGMEALDRNQSARGMRLSGSAMKEAMGYQTGMADQEFGNYWNRLAGMAGVGQTATNAMQNAGTQYANAYGQNALAAGQARKSGHEGVNDAWQGGIGNMFSILGMQKAGYFN